MELDLLIKNGKVIDGTGNPWYKADIGVRDGKIQVIGKLGNIDAKKTIDALENFITPGFIDAHSHGDSNTLVYRDMENITHQGITTTICRPMWFKSCPVKRSNKRGGTKNKRC